MSVGPEASSDDPERTGEASRMRVVFDFDGTLRTGDAFTGFYLSLLQAMPLRWIVVVLISPLAVALGLLPGGRRRFASVLLWAGTFGVSDQAVFTAMRRYAREAPGETRFFEAGIECLRKHQQAGDNPVIVTGAAEALVQELLREKQLVVPVIGSQLRRTFGGLTCSDHCFGRRKIEMLSDRGYPATWQRTYSDSPADLPILKAAAEAVLVNPNEDRILRISSALERAPMVRHWS